MRTAWISIAGCLLLGGCILEDNPAFMETEPGTSSGGPTSTGPGPTGGPSTDPTTSGSADSTGTGPTGGSSSTGSETGGPEGPGCDDPTQCTTYHIGPVDGSCTHEVDGVSTDACDWVGPYALRIAAATLEFDGVGGLIVMHDNNGVTASYVGSLDVIGNTTIRSADDASPDTVRVHSEDSAGVLRLRGDGVHLEGFTIACRSGGEWALAVRQDLDVEGTETGGHLIEGLVMVGTRPEDVGANSIVPVFQSLGPDTVVRNNHVWGYFEDVLDLRFATGSVLSHNTVIYYQAAGSPLIDASQSSGLEISNNVFASLTRPSSAFVGADDTTTGLVVVGNLVEGVDNLLGGLEITDPDVTLADNIVGPLEAESPRNPRLLADSALLASPLGASEGTSLDGVDLPSAGERLPGAYQTRSPLPLPRRSVITVGEGTCGASPCDVTKTFDNELQRAVWSAWPGTSVEIYPSATPYAGPAVVSWPIELRGMGTQPDAVVIRRQLEDQTLTDDGTWYGKNVVLDLTRDMSAPTVVELLTVEAGSEEIGIFHEGTSDGLVGRHEIRRVILRDDGSVAGDPADIAVYVGDEVVVHDVLIHGGYHTCVRFGPRASESSATPPSTAYVHHLTCRLTELVPDTDTPAAFEVASVVDVVLADVAVELVEPGPLFRAQRRSSGDSDPLVALDPPLDFQAHSFVTLGISTLFDGFMATDGIYTLTNVDAVLAMDPFFESAFDSHLATGALGIDSGVDPAMLAPGLSLGVSVDGVDRTMVALPDRGAYEQGQ
ncbi:MAG: hypothetical protein KDK70_12705 [Myxococcales bacterium]|nr:hypothetical protein [Myxococcales bacterium]